MTEQQLPADRRGPDGAALKETSSVRQAWVTALMVLIVAGIFVYAVIPMAGREGSGLEGIDAPDVALPVLAAAEGQARPGDRVRVSNLRGSVVVLDFWASWCRPCRKQVPVLEAVAAARPEVRFLGVNVKDGEQDARDFLEELKPSYVSVRDVAGEAQQAYSIEKLPTLVVIDPEGRIVAVREHLVTAEELKDLIARASSSSAER